MARRRPAPRPRPRANRADSKQIVEAIVAAALALGPAATTNAIAKRAGVGIASLYRYFPTTQAIFAEISRRLLEQFLAELRARLARPGLDRPTAMRELCRIALEAGGAPLALRAQLNLEVPLGWTKDSADAVYRATLAECAAWLRRSEPNPPADLDARVFAAFASVRGAVLMSLLYPELAPPTPDLVALLATSIDAVFTSSRSPASPSRGAT